MTQPFLVQAKPAFWPLQIAGWTAYSVLNSTAVIGEGTEPRYVFVSLGIALSGFFITSVLRLGYRRLWSLPLPRLATRAASLLLFATLVQASVYLSLKIGLHFCDDCKSRNPFSYMWYFLSMFYLLLSWSGLYFGIKFARQLQEEKETALKANALAHEAQLKMLRYQLNPHFLFNTLNAISTLVLDQKQDTANRMVGSLASFLRYSLDSDPVQRVTLAQEIEALHLYLSIEQIRFGERLQVSLVVDEAARTALVPSLILQPIVENAIKHAVAKREEGGHIEIEARRTGDSPADSWLDIHMRDDGPGCPDFDARTNHTGVGLANTRERLRVIYAERQIFSIDNREPHGADVHIRLPFEAAVVTP
ncbi:MAG: histidine kinase [Rudaea sp.]